MSTNKPKMDGTRRGLVATTAVVGGAAGLAAAVPFAVSMQPSERALALGAPVEADISKLQPGQRETFEWRGKPVWILRRTAEMIESVKKADGLVSDPGVTGSLQPAGLKNKQLRSLKDEFLVLEGVCSHLGCSPSFKPEDNMFFCPCHGSKFDLAGRVYKGFPAPVALKVPPHMYLSDTKILIGVDKET
jgi:ubiquinol-cytochrome c reductase iron-sulfur subunit